jgi:hypothetical protein
MPRKNENLLRLKELTETLCDTAPSNEYANILAQLKNIVDEGKTKVESYTTTNSKIKCYENMCVTITKILNKVKL